MSRPASHLSYAALAVAVSAALAGPVWGGPAITIYNQDLAAVRETVPLNLRLGENTTLFSGMTAQARPTTVILRDPTGRVEFRILEQNYRNDPASEARLLEYFEGQEIEFLVPYDDGHEIEKGRIIRAGDQRGLQPLIETGGRLRFGLPGTPLFPRLQDNGILRPTLEWQIYAPAAARFEAELAYLTGGFSWAADYNVVLEEEGDSAAFMGWISLTNRSGQGFNDAVIKLIAGDIQVVTEVVELPGFMERTRSAPALAMADARIEGRGFDEFHLYELPRPTSLRDQETKQVEFSRAEAITAPQEFIFSPSLNKPRPSTPGEPQEFQIATFRRIANTEANQLGIALPAGIVRFYRRDRDGRLEFVGEDRIAHTPKDETLRLHLGYAFDLVGTRETLRADRDDRARTHTQTNELRLRNRKETPVTIRVIEPTYGTGATVSGNSHPIARQNAAEVEFLVTVPAGAEEKVTYTTVYRW